MQDFRYAVRLLVRHPGFTLLGILALALGIGANTAIFSVLNGTLVRALPYPDSSRLVVIWDQLTKLGLEQFPVSYTNYLDYKSGNGSLEDVAAFSNAEVNLTARDQAERVASVLVTANLLPMLGAVPEAGRLFLPEENQPGRGAEVMLSDSLWLRRFGGDRGIIGRSITLDGTALTVVGILPAGFSFPSGNPPPEIWMPVELRPDTARAAGALQLVARMKPGIQLEQARADMTAIARGIDQRYRPYRGPRGEDAGYRVTVIPLNEQLYGGMRRGLVVLLVAVAFVLLIACANVANLLLARTAERRREIAVRQAMGAPRVRIVRQLLVESMVLALGGGALGLALAFWSAGVLRAMMPESLPLLEKIPVDARVFGFALLLSMATGLVFGIAPALAGSVLKLSQALRESGRAASGGLRTRRLGRLLVIVEVALSLVVVMGAGLLIESYTHLIRVHPGFRMESLITGRISLSRSQYASGGRAAAFYRDLIERVRILPGVESASVVSELPLTGGEGGSPFSIEGRAYDLKARPPQVAAEQVASAEYFHTMQIPLLAGRVFRDRESAPVVVINQTMARGFWPGGISTAIGRRILLGAPRPEAPWLTIVGVVGDVRNSGLAENPLPQMYVPLGQTPELSMALVIRTVGEGSGIVSAARAQLFTLDPNQPLYDVKSMAQRAGAAVAQPRFQTELLTVFAVLALALAVIGIYGVAAQSVAGRTHEIGIRMALGARPAEVMRSVLREGLAMGLAGIGLGFAGALAMSRLLSGLLFEVRAYDPAALLGASVVLIGAVVGACYVPARRAARSDPMAALRWE